MNEDERSTKANTNTSIVTEEKKALPPKAKGILAKDQEKIQAKSLTHSLSYSKITLEIVLELSPKKMNRVIFNLITLSTRRSIKHSISWMRKIVKDAWRK
jgi:hypothetical protein